MYVIYKYECQPAVEFGVFLPQDAEILGLGFQNEHGVFWARVNTKNPVVDRKFLLLPTGMEHPALAKLSTVHRGTFQASNATYTNNLVLHLFEITGDHNNA